jgi:chromosome segregation ATPase
MKNKSMIKKIINLSPLVDVFMIVIFWYIMFSNQNLQNQEASTQGLIESLHEQIGGLEDNLEKLEISKESSDDYIQELLEELKRLQEELEALKEDSGTLKTENEKLAALLEEEGQYLVLQLTEGTEALRILESTYKGKIERIPFNTDELEIMQSKLKTMITSYLENNSRLSVLFLYEGGNSFAKDVSAIESILEKMQKESYFVYTKKNLSRSK